MTAPTLVQPTFGGKPLFTSFITKPGVNEFGMPVLKPAVITPDRSSGLPIRPSTQIVGNDPTLPSLVANMAKTPGKGINKKAAIAGAGAGLLTLAFTKNMKPMAKIGIAIGTAAVVYAIGNKSKLLADLPVPSVPIVPTVPTNLAPPTPMTATQPGVPVGMYRALPFLGAVATGLLARQFTKNSKNQFVRVGVPVAVAAGTLAIVYKVISKST